VHHITAALERYGDGQMSNRRLLNSSAQGGDVLVYDCRARRAAWLGVCRSHRRLCLERRTAAAQWFPSAAQAARIHTRSLNVPFIPNLTNRTILTHSCLHPYYEEPITGWHIEPPSETTERLFKK
jgi:hypothetical protein